MEGCLWPFSRSHAPTLCRLAAPPAHPLPALCPALPSQYTAACLGKVFSAAALVHMRGLELHNVAGIGIDADAFTTGGWCTGGGWWVQVGAAGAEVYGYRWVLPAKRRTALHCSRHRVPL